MKKVIKFILILITILLMVLIFIISKDSSVQAADNGTIKLNVKNENFTPGGTVAVEILLQDQKQGISSFTAYFHYDENIFEKINSSNIESDASEEELDSIDYGDETGKISVAKDGTLIADVREDVLKKILISNVVTKRFAQKKTVKNNKFENIKKRFISKSKSENKEETKENENK